MPVADPTYLTALVARPAGRRDRLRSGRLMRRSSPASPLGEVRPWARRARASRYEDVTLCIALRLAPTRRPSRLVAGDSTSRRSVMPRCKRESRWELGRSCSLRRRSDPGAARPAQAKTCSEMKAFDPDNDGTMDLNEAKARPRGYSRRSIGTRTGLAIRRSSGPHDSQRVEGGRPGQ